MCILTCAPDVADPRPGEQSRLGPCGCTYPQLAPSMSLRTAAPCLGSTHTHADAGPHIAQG